jgi:hypothetical protein
MSNGNSRRWVIFSCGKKSEHLYSVTNLGLNIHSDMLCQLNRKAPRPPESECILALLPFPSR